MRKQKLKELKQNEAALRITKAFRDNKDRREIIKALQYFKTTGKNLATLPEDLQKLIQDLYDGLDQRVIRTVEDLSVMRVEDVKDLVDELAQRVFDLEAGQAATAHFHMVKPDDLDSSYSHTSMDMGPHTAPRAPVVQVIPEKDNTREQVCLSSQE